MAFHRFAACLAEGGAIHPPEVREEVGVVTPEVREQLRVFVYPQGLADALDREDLRVVERGGRAAPSEASEVLEPVVDEAEDGHDEGAKIHERRPPLRRSVWSLPSVGRPSLRFKPSMKFAHGVSYSKIARPSGEVVEADVGASEVQERLMYLSTPLVAHYQSAVATYPVATVFNLEGTELGWHRSLNTARSLRGQGIFRAAPIKVVRRSCR